MVWIKSFAVWGLAGRKTAVKHTMNRDINILWGTNGCGKTTLLKILHSALTGNTKILAQLPFERAEVRFYADSGEQLFTRRFDKSDAHLRRLSTAALLKRGIAEEDVEKYIESYMSVLLDKDERAWMTEPELSPHANLSHGYLPISRVSERDARFRTVSTPRTEALLDEISFDQLYADHIQTLWRRYSTEALQKTTVIQKRALSQVARTVMERNITSAENTAPIDAGHAFSAVNQFFRAQNLRPPRTTLTVFTKHYEEDEVFRQIVNDIVNVQYEVDSSSYPIRRIEELLNKLFYGNKKVSLDRRELTVRYRDKEVPLHSLASGEKQLLRLFLECLAVGGSCIIVDEPEISLHVDWQHELINYIQKINPSLQFIAATHSPEIMATLEDSKTFEL
jgi:energy-coupling factor transporter ATP-binding protein EcfA2